MGIAEIKFDSSDGFPAAETVYVLMLNYNGPLVPLFAAEAERHMHVTRGGLLFVFSANLAKHTTPCRQSTWAEAFVGGTPLEIAGATQFTSPKHNRVF